MAIWALADLHLAFSTPNKRMDVFGGAWVNYTDKIAANWRRCVAPGDLVLLPGDISWAMQRQEALIDLDWIDALPGVKVMIRGNHDYWWTSSSKVQALLPPSIHIIHNDAFHWHRVGVAGTRLWDSSEFSFEGYIDYIDNPIIKQFSAPSPSAEETEKVFLRELGRLEMSLKCLKPTAQLRLAMTHYPPIGPELLPTRTTALLEKYGIQYCIFGHVHSVRTGVNFSGQLNGIHYLFAACDWLDCHPLKVCEWPML